MYNSKLCNLYCFVLGAYFVVGVMTEREKIIKELNRRIEEKNVILQAHTSPLTRSAYHLVVHELCCVLNFVEHDLDEANTNQSS